MYALAGILLFFIFIIALLYHRISFVSLSALLILALVGLNLSFGLTIWTFILWGVLIAFLSFFHIPQLRFRFFTQPLYKYAKTKLPTISKSEEEALKAGTIGWEGQIFNGFLNWEKLFSYKGVELTEEEQAFLNGPVEKICATEYTAWDMWHKDLNFRKDLEKLIYENGILAMNIPKEYGGKGFSIYGAWQVHLKISKRIGPIINLVSIANSIAAGELIERYGTELQKKHYLPKLAKGEDIPCFALTSPIAGSDATAIEDYGIVSRGIFDGKEVLGIKLNFNKRYITMAPIATMASLAFKLYDPDHLMGEKEKLGVTLAFVPLNLPGVIQGRRHYPLGGAFPNGPLKGQDVFIPIENIIGGKEMIGRAWEMLTQALAIGRATSLPTVAVSNCKNTFYLTTVYSMIRKQFGVPIGTFEGVQEKLAEMASFTHIADALRLFTFSQIEAGEKPSIPAAISKYNTTELARRCAIHAVDLMGGKAVMQGPKNHVAASYLSAPVSVTIEGSNTLTRSLIVFGQGAVRCHPFILKEMNALHENDIDSFDQLILKHAGHSLSLGAKVFVDGLTNGHFSKVPHTKSRLKNYYQSLSRLSSVFALLSDLTMILQGGKLKTMEALSGKFADTFSMLFITSSILKHYHDRGEAESMLPIVEHSLCWTLNQVESNLYEILENHPNRLIAILIKALAFPLGRKFKKPSIASTLNVARLIQTDKSIREALAEGIYLTDNDNNPITQYEKVLVQSQSVEELMNKLYKKTKAGLLEGYTYDDRIEEAIKANIITKKEANALRQAHDSIMEILNVDDFSFEELQAQK